MGPLKDWPAHLDSRNYAQEAVHRNVVFFAFPETPLLNEAFRARMEAFDEEEEEEDALDVVLRGRENEAR